MSEEFYADGPLYDRLFPGGEQASAFYRAEAGRRGGSVLELGSGTGHKLLAVAADGLECVGLERSSAMLAEARRKADERGLTVRWTQGDMRTFDLGRTFESILVPANSLLHLAAAEDVVSCLRSVRRHLAPGGRLVLDVFNPDVRLLARADGTRRTRTDLAHLDPDRGPVSVDVAETYDPATQVTRGTWFLSSADEPDFATLPLEIRSIFPQELPLLVRLGGLRITERYGDWSRAPFTGTSPVQLVVCEAD